MLGRSHLGYVTQVWAPQSIKLVCKLRYILNLPFHCQRSYKDRLIQLNLLLLTYWQEYPDMVFFFKAVTARVEINPTVTPWTRAPTRTSRYTSNPDTTLCPIRYCKTTTFQRSFLTELAEYGMLLPQTWTIYCLFFKFF